MITIVNTLNLEEKQKEKVVALYLDEFGNSFSFIKGRDKQKEFFSDSIDFSTIYIALHKNEVVGFMGVSDNKKRCINFSDVEKFEQMLGSRKGRAVQKK